MAEYIYLSSSLPLLTFDGELPFTREEFLKKSESILSSGDFKYLSCMNIDNTEGKNLVGSGLLSRYFQWETALRNEIAARRGSLLGVPPERDVRSGGVGVDVGNIVSEAMKLNPLEGENYIDAERWKRLEMEKGTALFSLLFLAVYSMQLSILERRSLRDSKMGNEKYRVMCDALTDAAPTGSGESA